jgi:hypothetical protein
MILRVIRWVGAAVCLTLCSCSSSGGSGEVPGGGPADPGPDGAVSGLFNGARVDLSPTGRFPDGYAVYSPSQDRTSVLASPGDASPGEVYSLDVFVRGQATGNFSCGDEPDGGLTIGMTFYPSTSQWSATYVTTNSANLTPCTITITDFPAVGGHVKGTFAGALVATERAGPANNYPPQQMNVTKGVFDVTRQPDIP